MTSNNDDIQIELGQSQRRHIEHKDNPLESSGLCALPYDEPAADQIPIFIAETAMKAIEQHTRGTNDREVGGVLLGGFFRNEKGSFIEISDFIEAKSTRETDVSLTFTHETWEQINQELSARTDNAQIVGWYHSHPGLGVFMSREDEFIHSGFFTDPWQVAIVVDPIYHNWGCFKWLDGKLERTNGFYVYGSKKAAKNIKKYVDENSQNRKAAPRSASASADRRDSINTSAISTLWIAVSILLVLQIVIGIFVFLKIGAVQDKAKPPETAAYFLEHSDLSDAEQYLREELIRNPSKAVNDQLTELKAIQEKLTIKTLDSARLDLINLRLASADKMASTQSLQSSGTDPNMDTAVEIYQDNEITHTDRLARAKELTKQNKLADAEAQKIYSKKKTTKKRKVAEFTKQYANAEFWLKYENLRLIAYGLVAQSTDFQSKYDALGQADKDIVIAYGLIARPIVFQSKYDALGQADKDIVIAYGVMAGSADFQSKYKKLEQASKDKVIAHGVIAGSSFFLEEYNALGQADKDIVIAYGVMVGSADLQSKYKKLGDVDKRIVIAHGLIAKSTYFQTEYEKLEDADKKKVDNRKSILISGQPK